MVKLQISPRLKSILCGLVLVICVYAVVPTVVAWSAAFLAGCIAVAQGGAHALDVVTVQQRLGKIEGFFGELTLLIGSGLLAFYLWSHVSNLYFFVKRSRWREVAIGIIIGIVNYFSAKLVVVPWLYLARPLDSNWLHTQYYSVQSYGHSYIGQVASVFFVDTCYVSLVETIVFIGLLYQRLRNYWGLLTSLLFASAVFATSHRSELLFFEFFLFALINLAIYEWRRSLAAPFFHHVTFNALIYGSQLAFFSGLSGQ